MKTLNLIFYLILCLILVNCSSENKLLGVYRNKCSDFDMPMSILTLNKENYTLIYPSVIGEKEEGIWKKQNDTIFLYMKTEIVHNLKDTIKVDKEPVILLKKKNKLYSLKKEDCFMEK